MERASDEAIWRYARDNGFCIVTKDADFYDISLLRGAPPKVIWLKGGNVTKSAVTKILLTNKTYIEETLSAPDTTCVELY